MNSLMSTAPEIRFFTDRKGCKIAYSCVGDGPFVIIPAWWVSHIERDMGDPAFRDFIDALGDGLTLVRYDRPGVGLSDHGDGRDSLDSEAALLDDLVEELGADQYSLFAASCAGPPSIVHAAEHPDRVERLCFYGSYADGKAICPPEVQDAVQTAIKAHWGLGSRAMADIFLPDGDRAAVDSFARYQRDATDADTAAALLKMTYEMDASDRMADVKSETLILHRREERAIPYALAHQLAKGITGARLVTFEGSTHVPWIGGEIIARTANAFFKGRDHAPPATVGPSQDENGPYFDAEARRLVLDGETVGLTPLEFGVMSELFAAGGKVVTRDHLLEAVWKQPFEGSNRIDALIRGLRRKMGAFAPSIETVKGHGYRFAGWKNAG